MIRNDEHRNSEHNFTNKILLFFISGMNNEIECTFSKFSSDTKLHGAVDTLQGRDAIQRYLERWACVNLIKFNKAKYKVLLLGQCNLKHRFWINQWIEINPEEKDLEMLLD